MNSRNFEDFCRAAAVAEPHTKVGGAKAPQNFKKLIYSRYIFYILKM